jgi:hypothetical protein
MQYPDAPLPHAGYRSPQYSTGCLFFKPDSFIFFPLLYVVRPLTSRRIALHPVAQVAENTTPIPSPSYHLFVTIVLRLLALHTQDGRLNDSQQQ